MFFVLSKILNFVIQPLIWILLLILIALYTKNLVYKKKFLLASAILLLLFTNPFLCNVIMHAWEVQGYKASTITQPYDVGVVMGGSLRFYNSSMERIVYSSSVDRLLQSIDLLNQKKVNKLLLTGGSGFVMFKDIKESQMLANVLKGLNIPDTCIITENDSRNTHENAINTTTIIKEQFVGKRILIITSAIHIRRTRACFEKAGLQADYYPVDERSGIGIYTPDKIIIPNSECLDAWGALLHEWVGMIIYKLNGYC